MTIDIDQLEGDAAEEGAATEDKLLRVVAFAERLQSEETEVIRLENELKKAKEKKGKTEREDFPALMKELKLKMMELEDGSLVELTEKINCSIAEARKPEAHKWLVDNNFGGLIKTEVSISFGKDEREKAIKLAKDILTDYQYAADFSESVHPATLKSFVVEQLEDAAEKFPMDLFSVFQYNIVEIKLPKKKQSIKKRS